MFRFKRLLAILMAGALLAPMLPLEARTRKGDKFLAQGRAHEAKKEWDEALEAYEQALSDDPSDVGYQLASQKARFEASAAHVTNAVKIRTQGKLGEALIEFQKAFAINPANQAAEQEINRTQQMILRERQRLEETGKESAPEVRGLTPSEAARKATSDKVNRMLAVPELRPLSPVVVDLKINNQTPRILFETVAKYANLNILWDPDYQNQLPAGKDRLSIEFNGSTVEQALDNLALLTKSFWKPLNANTIFITNESPNKRRDFEEEVTKVFYLANTTTNQELTEILTAVRTVADCNRMFPIQAQNAIVAKCPADRMNLAEKIVYDLDKPLSEVVVDIVVIEASSVFTRSLASGIATTGLNVPASFTPRAKIQVQTPTTTPAATTDANGNPVTPTTPSSSTSGSSIPLSQLGHLASADWSTTLPGALLQATLSDTRTKVLQSPQIRSVDNQKATMKIGEREPTASGSFGSGLGGVVGQGISPLVQTQFQYIDVGVNVELTPHVHENGDVSLHISLEISSVNGNKDLGGISEPIIAQRKVEHQIRLKEGEISLLGGILNTQDSTTKTGIPFLSSIPGLGHLFRADSVDKERSELMIALIPHVVRRPDITAENLRSVASGNGTTIHVGYAARPQEPQPAPAPVPPAGEAPGQPAAVQNPAVPNPPVNPPAGGQPNVVLPPGAGTAGVPPNPPAGPPATAPPEGALPQIPPGTTAAQTSSDTTMRFDVAQVEKSQGETFTVTLFVAGAKDVAQVPMQLHFDPKVLSLEDAAPGQFWKSDKQEPMFTKNVQNDTGSANLKINRNPGAPGISGSGALLTLNFKAIGKGSTTVSAGNVTILNTQGQPGGSASPQVTVTVK